VKSLSELLSGMDRRLSPSVKAATIWEYFFNQGVIPEFSMEYANRRIEERGREMYNEAIGQMRSSLALKTQVPDFYKSAEIETGKLSQYVYSMAKNGRSCYIYGQFIPEKSYAACAAINELALYDGRRCLYVSAYDLSDLDGKDARNTTSDLVKAEFLVIDEVDKIDIYSNGGKALSKLAEIVDKRRGSVTIVTSNLSYKGLGGVYAKKSIQLSGSVISALVDACGKEIKIEHDGTYADLAYVAA